MNKTYLSPEDKKSLNSVAEALVLLGQHLKSSKAVNAATVNLIASCSIIILCTVAKTEEHVPVENN